MARVTLILNPVSGKGRARRALPEVRTLLEAAGHSVMLLTTDSPGAAGPLAVQARDNGCDALVTLGGDGTHSEAVDGLLAAGPWPDRLTITPLPLGTGNSFVRHFGPKTGDWQRAVSGLLADRRQWLDAAIVEPDGAPARHMVNVFGTGFMAHVAHVANRRFKRLGGAGYTAGVLWELARLAAPNTALTLDSDAPEALEAPLTLVAVCNTQWTGEDMWIAPSADPADGALDVITLGQLTRLALLRLFPKIFSGTHLSHPAVRSLRARQVRVAPRDSSPLLVDGEVLGRTPVTVRVLPRAFQVAL
jgi:diacylglycerol kinase (ATP)